MKSCKRCKQSKDLIDFSKNKAKKDGYNIYCKECCNKHSRHWKYENKSKTAIYRKRYRELNPDEARDYRLRSKYNLTIDDWNKKFEGQGKVCALCGSDKSDSKNFVVDHDHKTGKIRGILCSFCNRGLGMFKDCREFFEKAIQYLEDYK